VMNMTGIAVQLGIECREHGRGNCMARNLFSSSVSRTLSEKWKVKEAVESCAGGSKLEQVT